MRNTARKTQESHVSSTGLGIFCQGLTAKAWGFIQPCTLHTASGTVVMDVSHVLEPSTRYLSVHTPHEVGTFAFGETEAWSYCITVSASLCCCNKTPEEIT